MNTATEIANLALALCRSTAQVADVWADDHANALTLRGHLPVAVAMVSMAYAWPSQMVEAPLTLTVTQPEEGAYYAIPNGAFAVHKVLDGSPTPIARYQRDFDLRRTVPEPMKGLFALALAYHVVLPIARDNNLQAQLLQQYQKTLNDVRQFYAQRNHTAQSIHGEDNEPPFRAMALADGTEILYVMPKPYDCCLGAAW